MLGIPNGLSFGASYPRHAHVFAASAAALLAALLDGGTVCVAQAPEPAAAAEPAKVEHVQPAARLTPAEFDDLKQRVTHRAPEFFPQPNETEKGILQELTHPTKMNFSATPLQEAVDYLKDFHQIQIQLDFKALDDAGLGRDTEIDCQLTGIPLRSALRILLAQYGLAAVVSDDVLKITTQEVADSILITRTYPLGDLVADDDYQVLQSVITKTVAPTTWDCVGGPGNFGVVPVAKSLVISQTMDVHDEVLELLRALRAARCAAETPDKR